MTLNKQPRKTLWPFGRIYVLKNVTEDSDSLIVWYQDILVIRPVPWNLSSRSNPSGPSGAHLETILHTASSNETAFLHAMSWSFICTTTHRMPSIMGHCFPCNMMRQTFASFGLLLGQTRLSGSAALFLGPCDHLKLFWPLLDELTEFSRSEVAIPEERC